MPDQTDRDIRIGVYICHCGSNIAGYLDMEALGQFAETLPHVTLVQRNLYTCSEGGINEIKRGIKDLIRMGVAKAALLSPQEPILSAIEPRALVIGGGAAGMTAALGLANRGFEVVIVEKTDRLGGLLNRLNKLGPNMLDAGKIVEEKAAAVTAHPMITLFTGARVTSVQGFIGKYQADIDSQGGPKKIDFGVIIVATGARLLVPEGMFGYDGNRVITHLELERRLKEGLDPSIKNVVFIQCVGARNEDRPYCSRICCQNAVKNAMLIREARPDARVSILYRDMQMYGVENETLYRDSKANGIRYIHYSPSEPPKVGEKDVKVYHTLLGRELDLPADLVVLSTPLVAQEDAEVTSQLLRVPVDENGFFLEGHVKLKPLDFATDGVFLCGSARFPANLREVMAQGLGAASRASIPLSKGSVKVEPIISVLADEDACRGCGLCVALCPYGALEVRNTEKGRKVHVIDVACKGCGVCAATCYQHALTINSYTDQQIEAQIEAFLGK